jgi:hypothetical protein
VLRRTRRRGCGRGAPRPSPCALPASACLLTSIVSLYCFLAVILAASAVAPRLALGTCCAWHLECEAQLEHAPALTPPGATISNSCVLPRAGRSTQRCRRAPSASTGERSASSSSERAAPSWAAAAPPAAARSRRTPSSSRCGPWKRTRCGGAGALVSLQSVMQKSCQFRPWSNDAIDLCST